MGTMLTAASVAIRESNRRPLVLERNFQHPPGASPERSLR
jgi:hypothetical protein